MLKCYFVSCDMLFLPIPFFFVFFFIIFIALQQIGPIRRKGEKQAFCGPMNNDILRALFHFDNHRLEIKKCNKPFGNSEILFSIYLKTSLCIEKYWVILIAAWLAIKCSERFTYAHFNNIFVGFDYRLSFFCLINCCTLSIIRQDVATIW